jgi:hypothetical protein
MSRAAVFTALLALSGCKIFVKDDPPPCPRVSVVEDASKLVRFTGAGHDANTIAMSAEITKYRGTCFYDKDEKQMDVKISVGIDAFAGPAFPGGAQRIDYFVAIPAFSGPEGKKIFPVKLDIPKDPKGMHIDDGEVSLTFPVKDIKKLEAYEIFVGFQLTPEELDFNRKHDHR